MLEMREEEGFRAAEDAVNSDRDMSFVAETAPRDDDGGGDDANSCVEEDAGNHQSNNEFPSPSLSVVPAHEQQPSVAQPENDRPHKGQTKEKEEEEEKRHVQSAKLELSLSPSPTHNDNNSDDDSGDDDLLLSALL